MTDHDAWAKARTHEARIDPRSTFEFVSMALMAPDDMAAWDAVGTLQFRGTRDVFDAARQLCASQCSRERTLGADILGQLGVPDRTFPEESVATLLQLLDGEVDEGVIASTCIALGHTPDTSAVPSLVRFKKHPDASVRYAVAFALTWSQEELAIETKIEMSRDEYDEVRDWATFGLGGIEVDTPAIRAALLARVVDPDEMTRGEALMGLARRNDQRAIEPLITELERYCQSECRLYSVEAAEEFADPRLLPVLMKLKESADDPSDTVFDEAIRRCSSGEASVVTGARLSRVGIE